jgi:uncharacterized membrane protein
MTKRRTNIPPLSDIPGAPEAERSARIVTLVVYVLQAASFLVGVTFIAAVIVNYVKRDDVEGTWLASHFRWQVRTFWYGVLWGAVGLVLTSVGVGYAILFAAMVWLIYRIAKGSLRLADGKAMYGEGGFSKPA